MTRVVSRWMSGQQTLATKRYRAPAHAFQRRYTPADVALLAEVDRAMGTLSGPATACVLRRQHDVFGDTRFECLGSLSVGHLCSLRHSSGYRQQRATVTKTRPTKVSATGVRKAPGAACYWTTAGCRVMRSGTWRRIGLVVVITL